MRRYTPFFKLLLIAPLLLGSLCKKTPVREEPLAFQAPTLMAEYLKDVEAADKKYKGKEMVVSGLVAAVRQNDGIVILKGAPSPVANTVECDLTREGMGVMNNLVTNQGIVVRGRNEGWTFGSIRLRQCEVKGY